MRALLVAIILALSLAACGDDGVGITNKDDVQTPADADMQIYVQKATYNGVEYTCLLAGYSNYPGMWCERSNESTPTTQETVLP